MSIDLIVLAAPVLLSSLILEWWWGRRRGRELYRFADTITNLNLGVAGQVVGLFNLLVTMGAYTLVYEHFAVTRLPDTVWTVALCLVGYDFIYYWGHRWSHTVSFLWGAHVVHHSSEAYNLSVAFRQSWIHMLLMFPIIAPLAVIGFSPWAMLLAGGIVSLYQFWIHTALIDELPRWFQWVFNSPTHHRVHHAVNEHYVDKNYAALFIVWDRIFGTFEPEHETPRYGIMQPLRSWNPLWANMHHYADVIARMRSTGSWRAKLGLLLRRPSKAPQTDPPKPQDPVFAPSAPSTNLHVIVQSISIAASAVAFSLCFAQLDFGLRFGGLALFVWAVASCGALLEGARWAYVTERIRVLVTTTAIVLSAYSLWPEGSVVVLGTMVVAALTVAMGLATVGMLDASPPGEPTPDPRPAP